MTRMEYSPERLRRNDALRHDADDRPAGQDVAKEPVRSLDGLRGKRVTRRREEERRRSRQRFDPVGGEGDGARDAMTAGRDRREGAIDTGEAAASRRVRDVIPAEPRLEVDRDGGKAGAASGARHALDPRPAIAGPPASSIPSSLTSRSSAICPSTMRTIRPPYEAQTGSCVTMRIV